MLSMPTGQASNTTKTADDRDATIDETILILGKYLQGVPTVL